MGKPEEPLRNFIPDSSAKMSAHESSLTQIASASPRVQSISQISRLPSRSSLGYQFPSIGGDYTAYNSPLSLGDLPALKKDSTPRQGSRKPPKRRRRARNAVDGDAMAASYQRMSGDGRRHASSSHANNRYENRAPMPGVLCRNGPQCRKYQEGTCNYNHDFTSLPPNGHNGTKQKSLNVESPSFTPKIPNVQPAKVLAMTSKAAAAPNFTPRGSGAGTPASPLHSKDLSAEFASPPQILQATTQQFAEFVPGQTFLPSQPVYRSDYNLLHGPTDVPQMEGTATLQSQMAAYDPYMSQQLQQTLVAGLDATQQQLNPYVSASSGVAAQPFFQDANAFKHPLNYHLYASLGPKREKMLPYQRAVSDFFISDTLREDLQRKSEAALQTFANSALPQSVEYFHSLVALDTNHSKGASVFGLPSWIYKATSAKDGKIYALRRIEGFRLTSEAAIRTIQAWKRINNSSIVQIYDAFTGRWFGDSSLIIVTDYHPLSQTVAEKHFTAGRNSGSHRHNSQPVSEQELWGYIVQLANALSGVHEAGLAAQTIHPSKVLITAKNRLRLNCCGVLDIIRYEQRLAPPELQRQDLQDLGCLILSIATRGLITAQGTDKALEVISRTYSERMRACLTWLVTLPLDQQDQLGFTITSLLGSIADKIMSTFDSTLHQEDTLNSELMRELENGRLVRLLTKLNIVLERPEITPSSASASAAAAASTSTSTNSASLNLPSQAWSETGERYYLKLFRDYVFHQIDHDGRPVLDLGHILACLNKLDAGVDEKIQLVSRDEQNCFVVSYREVKRGFEGAWGEISKAASAARR